LADPRIVIFTTLFPHPGQPNAGLFIRERMFRVAQFLPLTVVAPVPWFPLQGLIRLWRPHFRPVAPKHEIQDGIEVWHPRFFSIPGLFKSFDGFFMALGSLLTLLRLKKHFHFNLIDAHFAYPDGYAATLLGRWLKVPVTITLRGTEIRHASDPALRKGLVTALTRAARVFSVSDSLKRHAVGLGIPADKIQVDIEKFFPMDKLEARNQLKIPPDAPVLISVGALVERKGFHRVIDCLPTLLKRFPDTQYLIVGGASPEGDIRTKLEAQVARLGLARHVHFVGAMPSKDLRLPLSAADVFVLSTRNEGWANVFLEAMACGLPVIATNVGGNREVVCRDSLGCIVPFGDQAALTTTIEKALACDWDRPAIISHAKENDWTQRVKVLTSEFQHLLAATSPPPH
jgi:glycosyltransferase involved in cell wall biosynthesis